MATLIDLSLDTDEPEAEQQGVLFVEGRNEPIKFPIHLGPANTLREAGLFLTHDLYDMDDNEYRRPLPESQQRWVLASRGTSTIPGKLRGRVHICSTRACATCSFSVLSDTSF
jgi:hypothetical protein